ADANYVLAAAGWNDDLDIPGMAELHERYKERFNENMDVQSAGGFSVAALIWYALETAQSTDRDAIRDAIAGVNLTSGDHNFLYVPGGKFNDVGANDMASGVVMQINDQVRKSVYPFELTTEEVVWPKPNWS